MKRKLFVLGMVMVLLLSSITTALGATTSLAEAYKENPMVDVESITETAHEKIIKENEIDIKGWIVLDISDLPDVSKGLYPNIPQEVGQKLTRQYYIGQIEEKYHQKGDYKPLFLINCNLQTAKVGFLHENGETTIIDIDLDKVQENSVENLRAKAPYSVSGSCSLKKTTSGASYGVTSTGNTTTSQKVDDVYCSITTYINGRHIGFTTNHKVNASAVSVSFIAPLNQFPAQYEVQGTHFGFLGDFIVDNYSTYSKSFSN